MEEFWKGNHFCEEFLLTLAYCATGPCHDVYTCGRKIFDKNKYKGRFTEEIKALLRFHTMHGSNWQKISELTGHSQFALEKKFSQISSCRGATTHFQAEKLARTDFEDFDENELKVDQQETFLLADIFKDIEESCDDSDEESGQRQKE
ncbi:transcription termination factor 1-like [Myxocyprinus asiaticus]|uniref:transcription termination factor 1-like n=1 Tax=Myxocyprinus asiaticus TaxID=70543 RepID=UPI002223A320|nr:transcription termination factor 1-like [Myxocyprinus asiaticus]